MRPSVAERALAAADPVLAGVIERLGPCRLRARRVEDPFAALVRSIVGQMVSGKAAKSVYGRLLEILDEETPSAAHVARRRVTTLRKAGLSTTKATAIRELARRVARAELPLTEMGSWSDAEIARALTDVPGIGPWTANMFLMFHLGRPDVFPAKDLGVQEGMRRAYELEQRPTPREAARRAEVWAPHRSTGAWYMWRVLDGPAAL